MKTALKAKFRETVLAAEKALGAIKVEYRSQGSSQLRAPVGFRKGRRRYRGRTATLDAMRVAFDRLQGGDRAEDKRDLAFEIAKSLGVPMHEGLEDVEKLIADRFLVEDQGLLRLIPVEFAAAHGRDRERWSERRDYASLGVQRLNDVLESLGKAYLALDSQEKSMYGRDLERLRDQLVDLTSRMGSRVFSERRSYQSSPRARADVSTALRKAGGFADRLTLAIAAGKVSGVGQRAAEEAIEDMIQEGELEIAAGSLVSFGSLTPVGFKESRRRMPRFDRRRYDVREDAEEVVRILTDMVGEDGLEDFADGFQGLVRWMPEVRSLMKPRWSGDARDFDTWNLAMEMIRERYG